MKNQVSQPKQDKKAPKLVIKTGEKAGKLACW